jgi:hypothetical protein
MDIKRAIKRQNHAALAMLRQGIERCPDDLWVGGEFPRNPWRIAYHAAAYAHLYLYANLKEWKQWPKHRQECTWLVGDDVPMMEPYTRAEMLELLDLIDQEVDERIDALDLNEATCGFTWYPDVSRVELMFLSLRHLHGHIGQLSELLIARGLDIDWMGPPPK